MLLKVSARIFTSLQCVLEVKLAYLLLFVIMLKMKSIAINACVDGMLNLVLTKLLQFSKIMLKTLIDPNKHCS